MSTEVYLSYSRESGATEARLLQSALQARGVQSFLDVADMGAGAADAALMEVIPQLPNFVVLLSPAALDHCRELPSLICREIGQALHAGGNVVPVLLPGFVYPPDLPEELQALLSRRAVIYDPASFDAMLAEIISCLRPAGPLAPTPQVAAAPRPLSPFNWRLAGLLFVAMLIPNLAILFSGAPPSILVRVLGHAILLSCAMALVTTLLSQRVGSALAILALCGLTELFTSYILNLLLFAYFSPLTTVFSFLFGALVPGSIAVTKFPALPRWALVIAPVAGAFVYTVLSVLGGLPGLQGVLAWVSRWFAPVLIGAAFYYGVKDEDLAV